MGLQHCLLPHSHDGPISTRQSPPSRFLILPDVGRWRILPYEAWIVNYTSAFLQTIMGNWNSPGESHLTCSLLPSFNLQTSLHSHLSPCLAIRSLLCCPVSINPSGWALAWLLRHLPDPGSSAYLLHHHSSLFLSSFSLSYPQLCPALICEACRWLQRLYHLTTPVLFPTGWFVDPQRTASISISIGF